MATIFSVTYRMYKSVTECPVCTFQWVFRKNISVNKILLIFTFYWHRICIAPPVFSLILQCLLWKIWIIAWNISACLANITSLCQGQHFPIFCSPPPKWIYNISITSHCAKCSWGHKCCGDKYKIFFLLIFLHKLCLIFQVWFLLFFPCEIHRTLAFAWFFILNKVNIWSDSCLSLYFPPVANWLWDFTEKNSVLYISLKFSAWLTQWAKYIISAVPSCKSVTSCTVISGCHFSRLFGLLLSCKRRKRLTISVSSPCYFSQYPPIFLVPRELCW